MMNKLKKFIMNPWTVSIGSSLFVLLVTIVIDILTAEKIFSTFKGILMTVWTCLLNFLRYELKVWWLLIGIFTLIFVLWIWMKYSGSTHTSPAEPDFLKYTQDTILGYKWRWAWEKGYQGKYSIVNLQPICSHCGTPLIDNTGIYSRGCICLRCNNRTNNPISNLDNVELMIQDNVRRRYFSNE